MGLPAQPTAVPLCGWFEGGWDPELTMTCLGRLGPENLVEEVCVPNIKRLNREWRVGLFEADAYDA